MFDDPGRQRKDFWLIRRKKTPCYYIKFILKLPDGSGKTVIRSTKQTVKYRAERKAREMLKLAEPIQPVKKADPTALVTFEQVALAALQAVFKDSVGNRTVMSNPCDGASIPGKTDVQEKWLFT